MGTEPSPEAKQFRVERSRFEQTVLLLQGGGALGSYQAGVYQALAEANLHPDWVAGISIGAVNAALIAGNPPEKRVERLREFWEAVSTPPLGVPYLKSVDIKDDFTHRLVNQTRALGIMMFGAPHFFTPRPLSPVFWPSPDADQLSFYDVAPLKATLERLVDFDRLNAGAMRFSVGAVNVKTANFAYFGTTTHRIGPAHIIASGSLPPGFPATAIDGEFYWDGGLVSNTPLQWILDSRPRLDTLAFRIDLWTRQVAAQSGRSRRAAEGNPVLQPHACGDRSVQAGAEAPHRLRQCPPAVIIVKKKGAPGWAPSISSLVVIRIFELRHRLELLLGAAHHGMIGYPIIGAGRARGGRRRCRVRRGCGCTGSAITRRRRSG